MIAPTVSMRWAFDTHVVVYPFGGFRFCRTMGLGVFADPLASGRAPRAHISHYLLPAVFPIRIPTLTKGCKKRHSAILCSTPHT
jgi:hypothetical protein